MTTRFISLLMAVSTMGAAALFAQEGATKPAEGTLTLDEKTYTLKHALAYETTIDNEEAIEVVLSNQAVSAEQLKEARAAEKEGGDPNSGVPSCGWFSSRRVKSSTGAPPREAPRLVGGAARQRENSNCRTAA